MLRAAIIVPTIRETSLARFLAAWHEAVVAQPVIVVEDNPERSFSVGGANVQHYSWQEIDQELGDLSWIIPRRSDCIRSFGFYKALTQGAEMIITLDDDCYPQEAQFLEKHGNRLSAVVSEPAWVATGQGLRPRGMPYLNGHRQCACAINHGLWSNIPDLDAVTQLLSTRLEQSFVPVDQVIPRGSFFPMCGMNLAFRAEIAPAMYFLLMGRDWPFDRFGDIWCGIFAKKICDHLGYAVRSGAPLIEHQRASQVWSNLRKELPGYEVNEQLWSAVDAIVLTGSTAAECYRELANKLPLEGDYWRDLRRAMHAWVELVGKRPAVPRAQACGATS